MEDNYCGMETIDEIGEILPDGESDEATNDNNEMNNGSKREEMAAR